MKNSILFFALLLLSCSKEEPAIIPEKEMEEVMDEQQKDIAEVDAMVASFIQKYDIPGASLAIAKNERLVYQKAYGMANIEGNKPTTTDLVFRLASCSKPYTGMAIMKLVEEGRLSLDDKVFGEGAVLGTQYGTKAYSEDLKSITIRHMLHNVSGAFVNGNKRDMINDRNELNHDQFISYVLDNMVQEFTPGTEYHYVNVNFFMASKVVEKVSGMTFYQYMNEKIFKSIGDEHSNIGDDNPADNEVNYYGQGNLKGFEYRLNMNRYYGAGAMVSTASSVLRFATAIDGKDGRKDLLSTELLNEYTSGSSAASGQGLGIATWGNRLYFYGSLPGTRTGWILDKNTGLAAAILFNGNLDYTVPGDTYRNFTFAVQDLLVDFVTKQRNYQNIDQFND